MEPKTADFTKKIAHHHSLLIVHHSSPLAGCLALILFAGSQRTAQAQYPVRWTRAVAPPSRSALEAKLRKPVKKPRGQDIHQHFGRGAEIRTCVDYLRALKDGWSDSASTYEITTESFFKDQCDVAWLTLAAKPSRVSYVRGFKLNEAALDRLPPFLSPDAPDDEAAEAERKGLSWKKFKPGLKVVGKGADWITVNEDNWHITLELKAFGDFNGDGVEDVLLFKSDYALEGTMRGYWPVILTRVTAGGPFKGVEVEDKAILKVAARVMHTGSAKAANRRVQ